MRGICTTYQRPGRAGSSESPDTPRGRLPPARPSPSAGSSAGFGRRAGTSTHGALTVHGHELARVPAIARPLVAALVDVEVGDAVPVAAVSRRSGDRIARAALEDVVAEDVVRALRIGLVRARAAVGARPARGRGEQVALDGVVPNRGEVAISRHVGGAAGIGRDVRRVADDRVMHEALRRLRRAGAHPHAGLVQGAALVRGLAMHPGVPYGAVVFAPHTPDAPDRLD